MSNRDLTDKPNRNQNRIKSESGKESKGDINISVVDLVCFVMVTGEVSGIRLHRFLINAFACSYCTWHNFSISRFVRTR